MEINGESKENKKPALKRRIKSYLTNFRQFVHAPKVHFIYDTVHAQYELKLRF